MNKSIALHILGALAGGFGGLNASTIPHVPRGDTIGIPKRRGKGQLRNAKPKASGAARLKRAATKRNNIRKHG